MKEEMFEELKKSLREGGAILRGDAVPSRSFVMKEPNARSIRKRYALSQKEFAELLGISLKTLRNWEQGRRKPQGPARVLLLVAAEHPNIVWDVVRPKARE